MKFSVVVYDDYYDPKPETGGSLRPEITLPQGYQAVVIRKFILRKNNDGTEIILIFGPVTGNYEHRFLSLCTDESYPNHCVAGGGLSTLTRKSDGTWAVKLWGTSMGHGPFDPSPFSEKNLPLIMDALGASFVEVESKIFHRK
jgi:hypothetical protein